MENILPNFKSFSIDKEKVNPVTDWIPAASKPPKKNASFPYYLDDAIEKDESPLKGIVTKANLPAPNERYIKNLHGSDHEPSPLSQSERLFIHSFVCISYILKCRGSITEKTTITIPNLDKVEDVIVDTKNDESFSVRLDNLMINDLDFYFKDIAVESIAVRPNSFIKR